MKALVVVDMQNDFITGPLGSQEAQEVVAHVAEQIRAALDEGNDVFFTMDTHAPDYRSTQEGRRLPVEHCIEGTPGWELCGLVREACGNYPATQFRKGAFGSPELAAALSGRGYDEITLLGVCTDICVISNAMLLKAFLPEARIVVDAAGCAGVSPQSHCNALEAMRACQIDIL